MYIGGMMLNSYISISRNKLFVLSFIFVLILLIFLHMIYFERFSRNVLKNDFSAKRFHDVEKHGNKIKVAAIGTSHTDDGLEEDFDYFFNYGRMSTYFPQVGYAKVSHLLKYAHNLKVLLLEVDHLDILGYDHLTHTSMPDNHLYLLKHVNELLYDENKININNAKPAFFLSLQSDIAPVIHRKYFQDYLLRRGKKEIANQWSKLTVKEKIESAKKRVHTSNLDSLLEIDQAVRDYYYKAIKKAKDQGVKIYLIFYPQTKEYFSAINEKNNLKVERFISDLAKKENVTVLDYRNYFEANETFFENQDHLNKKGSEILTKEIMQVIHNDL